jgi:methionyl-tRNA formyltransferase
VHRAVIAGEAETGVTIMRVVKALDAGPMMATVKRPIGGDETSAEVERDLARLGADLLVEVVDRLAAGTAVEVPQDEAAATYAQRLTKDDGIVDWGRSAREIHDQVRGLHPWPHASSVAEGRRYILLRSKAIDQPVGRLAPGSVIESTGDTLTVATGSGILRILQIQPEGKRALSAREFLSGHRFSPGARFSAPA